MKKIQLTQMLLLLLLLLSCSNDNSNYRLLATEKTLPENFHEVSFERKSGAAFQYLLTKVTEVEAFEKEWDYFGFQGNVPNTDFQEKSVVFIGLQESGSCPYKLKEITIDKAKKAITVPFSDPKGNCTADATPRTFVLELENEMIRDIEKLIIVQSGYTTEMPFTN